jgi:hypothetical protein
MGSEMSITRDELLTYLIELQSNGDNEVAHAYADSALLDYINDEAIENAFNDIDKWYA